MGKVRGKSVCCLCMSGNVTSKSWTGAQFSVEIYLITTGTWGNMANLWAILSNTNDLLTLLIHIAAIIEFDFSLNYSQLKVALCF